ncbi:MAG: hypothetical protein ACO1SX_06755 [Actinomycetota bacterium]
MPGTLNEALSDPGPHTAESLHAKLPHFPLDAIHEALEALAAQGVLERQTAEGGQIQYRYVAPEKYVQHNLDVVRDPAKRGGGPGR